MLYANFLWCMRRLCLYAAWTLFDTGQHISWTKLILVGGKNANWWRVTPWVVICTRATTKALVISCSSDFQPFLINGSGYFFVWDCILPPCGSIVISIRYDSFTSHKWIIATLLPNSHVSLYPWMGDILCSFFFCILCVLLAMKIKGNLKLCQPHFA